MSNAFNIKRTVTNGDGVSLNSVAHPRPTNKIDLIIDALSVAQNSVWSALNQEALAAARELQVELANREWVGLSVNEGRDFFESKLTRAELIADINEFLEDKNEHTR